MGFKAGDGEDLLGMDTSQPRLFFAELRLHLEHVQREGGNNTTFTCSVYALSGSLPVCCV